MMKGREISNQKLYVHALDGLRGIAVLTVFLSHTSLGGHQFLPFLSTAGIGKMGVFLFFILSSFLLTYPFLLKAESAFSKDALINFSYRRFFRIYPLFVFYLLVAWLSSQILSSVLQREEVGIPFFLTARDFLQHLFLQEGKGVTWSILVEFRYYFLLPILAYVFAVFTKERMLLQIGAVMVFMALSQFLFPQSAALNNDIRLWPYLPVMLMGTLLAILQYYWKKKQMSQQVWAAKMIEALGWFGVLGLILMVPAIYYPLLDSQSTCAALLQDVSLFIERDCHKIFHHDFIQTSLLWSFVLFAALNGTGWLQRFFEWKPLRYLGWISFSFYLWHPCILMVFRNVPLAFHGSILFWLELALTIGISHLSYHWVEIPSSQIRYQPAQPSK